MDESDLSILDKCRAELNEFYPEGCYAGHHIMPSLNYAGGKLTLLFYDFREDHYPTLFNHLTQNVLSDDAMNPIDPSLPPADATAFEPLPVRHTIDARVAVADATGGTVVFSESSLPVSRYLTTMVPVWTDKDDDGEKDNDEWEVHKSRGK